MTSVVRTSDVNLPPASGPAACVSFEFSLQANMKRRCVTLFKFRAGIFLNPESLNLVAEPYTLNPQH